MANIEINLDVIDKRLSSTTTKITNKCTNAYNYVDSLKSELPYKIKDKNNINERLTTLRANCNILENNFNRLEKNIIKVLNRYVKFEQGLTKDAKKINPKEVKVKQRLPKKTKIKRTNTIKVNYTNINKINNSMQKDFVSSVLFNREIDIKVSNYDSGVCAAVMVECKSIIIDTIQIDDTYYFQNLNTQKVVEDNIAILNDSNIDHNKEKRTRTVNEILGVTNSEYINSLYIIEHANDIDKKITNDSVLDDTNKTFNNDYKNDTNYNRNDKTLNNIKDSRNNSLSSETSNDVNFNKKETSIEVETLSVNTEKANNLKMKQGNIEYETLEDTNFETANTISSKVNSNYERINTDKINNETESLNIKYEDII